MQLIEQIKMLLTELKLSGIRDVIEDRLSQVRHGEIDSADLLLSLLLDEKNKRQQNRYEKRMKAATLGQQASVELIDWSSALKLYKARIKELVSCTFITAKENIIITGPSGVGKSYLAALLGHHGCRQNYNVLYKKASYLFDDLMSSRADGSYQSKMHKLIDVDLLILDDWALKPASQNLSSDFYDIISERYDKASTVITSQRDIKEWYNYVADPLIADACLDRLIHNAHKIEITGDSYRKKKVQLKNAKTMHLQQAENHDIGTSH